MNTHSSRRDVAARRFGADGSQAALCSVADEVPVCLAFNGISHVVVMATPADLVDLAAGFALTDGISGEIGTPTMIHDAGGIRMDIPLPPAHLRAFLARGRRRNTASHTSCGICGIATIEALPMSNTLVNRAPRFDDAAARRALVELPAHQTLSRSTGATHAAAWAAEDGAILLVREDVGRHNALDKLIGARLRADDRFRAAPGFCVITSRCSFEMVQKAAAAGIGLLVAVSAPTSLAIDRANALGLTLVALARTDSRTMYAGPELALTETSA